MHALQRYDRLAPTYDETTTRIARIREDAIASLNLLPGQIVLDVACGTGQSLPALAALVCPEGKAIGVEQSPAMAAVAQERASSLPNGALARILVSPMALLDVSERFDAVLLSFTHDVLLDPEAIQAVVNHAKPGARIAVAGLQFLPWWWAAPVNVVNAYRARHYLTSFRGLTKPWRPLLTIVPNLTIDQTYLSGSCYRGSGTIATTDVGI